MGLNQVLNMNYKEFMSRKSVKLPNRRRDNDESRNFVDINLNDDDTPNQGAMDSNSATDFSKTEDIAEQEGRERKNETTTPTTTTDPGTDYDMT